eukprot:TRINITY_DN9877_c0_g1_i1.p1 TRINITY_DN9877_c0_g1~~TRINITY_DN9877_c0_g1_i1.p1  ORF type:complete len:243 (-),score=4.83 TRINITY_DN9877_c0_g1_i1:95-823(-)
MSVILVDHISDELAILLFAFSVFLFVFVYVLYSLCGRRLSTPIHPLQLVNVNEAREQRGINIDNENNTDPDPEIKCPICWDAFQHKCETNCGHEFCGACIISYYNSSRIMNKLTCPCCRRTVNLLIPRFTQFEQEHPDNTTRDVLHFNRHFSGQLNFLDYIYDAPVIIRNIFVYMFEGRIGWYLVLRLWFLTLFFMLYLLLPFDVLPEALFGVVGMIDDVIVFVIILVHTITLGRLIFADMR